MISFASTSPASVLPQPSVTSGNTPANVSSGDDSASFSDVMQQQQDSSTPSQPDNRATPPAGTPAPNTPASTTEPEATTPETPPAAKSPAPTPATTPTTAAPAKPAATPTSLAPAANLSAMLIQAAVRASNAPTTAAASVTTPSQKTTTPGSDATDLSSLIAEATTLLSSTATTVSPKTATGATPGDTTKAAKDSGSGKTAAKASTTTASTPMDLSTLIAQSSLLAQASTTAAGKDLPLSGVAGATANGSSKEKKSATSGAGGSFLQSGTGASSSGTSTFGLLTELQSVLSGATANQQLASATGAKNSSLAGASASTSSVAGTANVEKGKAMNSDLNLPGLELLAGNGGGNAVPSQSSADLHVQLASNHDFTDALTQVMHVAQLAETNGSRTPMRVEIEIQTPPGAIVNVYVSKQNDQWRAQLSTNDPAALSWVQDQVTSLRQSSDVGVEVKWLPPQLEGTGTIATANSQESNLSWNQGGQGQSQYQQQDERQQSGRQQHDEDPSEFATVQSAQFTNTLTALGRAA